MKGLVERIDQAMKARHIKQGPLAKALGTGQPTISDWIRGEKDPGAENILKLPTALNVDGHWLLTGDGEMDRVPEAEATKQLRLIRAVLDGEPRSTTAEMDAWANKEAERLSREREGLTHAELDNERRRKPRRNRGS